MLRHKERIPISVIVVKSRLLDVEKSLESTAEETLRMTRETIDYLQQNGLEVFVDFEHAMDANCGGGGRTALRVIRSLQAQPRVFPAAYGTMRTAAGESDCYLRHERRVEPGRSDARH